MAPAAAADVKIIHDKKVTHQMLVQLKTQVLLILELKWKFSQSGIPPLQISTVWLHESRLYAASIRLLRIPQNHQ